MLQYHNKHDKRLLLCDCKLLKLENFYHVGFSLATILLWLFNWSDVNTSLAAVGCSFDTFATSLHSSTFLLKHDKEKIVIDASSLLCSQNHTYDAQTSNN